MSEKKPESDWLSLPKDGVVVVDATEASRLLREGVRTGEPARKPQRWQIAWRNTSFDATFRIRVR